MGSYRGHGNLALETPADGIVNTLGLAPGRRHTLEAVRLVAVEAVGAYAGDVSPPSIVQRRSIEIQAPWTNSPSDRRISSANRRPSHTRSISFSKQYQAVFSRHSLVEGRCYPSLGRSRSGIGNIRFLTMGMCFFAATILDKTSVRRLNEAKNECRDSLCRCCRVSPGVRELSSRDEINLENFTLARASGRSTLVRFERPKRMTGAYVSIGLGWAVPCQAFLFGIYRLAGGTTLGFMVIILLRMLLYVTLQTCRWRDSLSPCFSPLCSICSNISRSANASSGDCLFSTGRPLTIAVANSATSGATPFPSNSMV